ncbi:hypothetical protein HET69_05710 [Streptomyces sp. CJ_13]|nr:hypothetical protein [Streptomyces sp. CJ_13]MBT1183517.1 hypothetical protein [Streptomyces sp. CJ_13]
MLSVNTSRAAVAVTASPATPSAADSGWNLTGAGAGGDSGWNLAAHRR